MVFFSAPVISTYPTDENSEGAVPLVCLQHYQSAEPARAKGGYLCTCMHTRTHLGYTAHGVLRCETKPGSAQKRIECYCLIILEAEKKKKAAVTERSKHQPEVCSEDGEHACIITSSGKKRGSAASLHWSRCCAHCSISKRLVAETCVMNGLAEQEGSCSLNLT